MTRVAIVGLGRAGRARERALRDHPRAELVGVARSRPGAGELSFDELLAAPSIDAAIICTPNAMHPRQAQALLESGRHVAVEFPLAPTVAQAADLFALARRLERVLHVEHIELLSPTHAAQVERAADLGRPSGGQLYFKGGSEGWLSDPAEAGSAPLLALARLHRLVALFGEAEVEDATFATFGDRYRLEIRLQFRAGGTTTLIEERGVEVRRSLRWSIECDHGKLGDPPPAPPAGLFRLDLDHFLDRIEGEAEPYVPEERILHVLDLVGEIETRLAV